MRPAGTGPKQTAAAYVAALREVYESLPDGAFNDVEADCRGPHEALALTWLAAVSGLAGRERGGQAVQRVAAPW